MHDDEHNLHILQEEPEPGHNVFVYSEDQVEVFPVRVSLFAFDFGWSSAGVDNWHNFWAFVSVLQDLTAPVDAEAVFEDSSIFVSFF